MTRPEQAVVIWSLLRYAAQMQRVLTYTEVEDCTGVLRFAQDDPLHLIYLYCKDKGYPQLNSLVVSQDTGFPGGTDDKYPEPMTPLDFLVERARIFAFGWSAKHRPSADDFVTVKAATV